jgi:hypothetical protein
MEILISLPTCPLVVPCPHMLLALIIQGDFPIIPFLILAGIFLVSGTTDKIHTITHFVVFKLNVQLAKIS